MKRIAKYGKRGFVLVLSLLTATILLALIIPYVSRVVTDYGFTSKTHDSIAALNLAEAGAERAIWGIVHNGATSDFTIPLTALQSPSGESIGEYEATVIFTSSTSAAIESHGYVPNKLSHTTERTIRLQYARQNWGMAVRAAGDGVGAITLGVQDIINSYNSDLGTYAATKTSSYGNIATNGSIVFQNQAKVWGDARPGAGYPFPAKPTNVSGAWGTLAVPLTLDPIPQTTLDGDAAAVAADAADASTNNNNGSIVLIVSGTTLATLDGDKNLYVVSGKTITLPGSADADNPAKYYFKSVTLDTQAIVNVSGAGNFVEIYVDGGSLNLGTQTRMNVSGTSTIYVGGGDMNISNTPVHSQGYLTVSGPSAIYVRKNGTTGGNINIGTQGKLNLFSGTSAAPGTATIYANGNVNVGTQGDVNVGDATHANSQATFFVDGGNINVSTQGDINNTGKPKDLSIYSSGSSIALTTQTDFYGAIYAPNAAVTLTTQGDIFGAVACNTFSGGTQAGIHFDRALLNVNPVFANNGVTSWQEI